MPAFRVIVIDEESQVTTVVMTELDRAPDVGEMLELPHHFRVTVRHVVNDPDDKLGVVIAAPA